MQTTEPTYRNRMRLVSADEVASSTKVQYLPGQRTRVYAAAMVGKFYVLLREVCNSVRSLVPNAVKHRGRTTEAERQGRELQKSAEGIVGQQLRLKARTLGKSQRFFAMSTERCRNDG